jgi:hypothetical protein
MGFGLFFGIALLVRIRRLCINLTWRLVFGQVEFFLNLALTAGQFLVTLLTLEVRAHFGLQFFRPLAGIGNVVFKFGRTFLETLDVCFERTNRALCGGSASATVAASRRMLIGDFIFEVADSGWETTVGSHVGVAEQTETEFEIERLGESLLLKDAGADDLAGNGGEDFILASGENINLCDLGFLVELLGAELDRLPRSMVLGLQQCGLEEQLPQQIRVVEILGVALKECDRSGPASNA